MNGDTWDDMRGSDIIDTRDIVQRIMDIESELGDDVDEAAPDTAAYYAEIREELDALNTLVEDYGDSFGDSWRDGVTLIADWHFEDYARELAEDIGAISRDMPWPITYIDWEAAANALKQDYSSIEIEGTTYWGQG